MEIENAKGLPQQGQSDTASLEKLLVFLELLPNKLAANPYDYALYTEWIDLAKSSGDMSMVNDAREGMDRFLALTEDMWKDWIADQSKVEKNGDKETQNHTADLYKRAIKDHPLSVNLWLDYIAHSVNIDGGFEARSKESRELQLYEGSLEELSHHYTDGSKIWRSLKTVLEAAIERSDKEDRDALIEDLDRRFLERLSVPHEDIEQTFADYSTFVTRFLPVDYEAHMVKTNKICSSTRKLCGFREKFEQELSLQGHAWSAYRDYIQFLSKGKNVIVAEIKALYERSLVFHSLNPYVWDQYIVFLTTESQFEGETIKKVIDRALRFCPSSGSIWAHLLIYHESVLDFNSVQDVFSNCIIHHALDQSVEDMVQLLLARLDIVRRIASDTEDNKEYAIASCKEAVYILETVFKNTPDTYYRVQKHAVYITANIVGDVDTAKEIWKTTGKHNKQSSEYWIQYAEFLCKNEAPEEARIAYNQAVIRNLDWPERVYDAWVNFERDHGSIDTYYKALQKIQNQQRHVEKQREKEYIQQSAEAEKQESSLKYDTNKKKRKDVASTEEIQSPKRSKVNSAHQSSLSKDKKPADSKKPSSDSVIVSGISHETKAAQLKAHFKECGPIKNAHIKKGDGDAYAFITFSTEDAVSKALELNGSVFNESVISVKIKDNKKSDTSTLYVCNFTKDVSKDNLEELFEKYGKVINIRMPQGSKLFAYVQFEKPEEAKSALVLNGHEIAPGIRLMVDVSNPSKARGFSKQITEAAESFSVRLTNFNPKVSDDEIRGLAEQVSVVRRLHRNKRGDKIFIDMNTAEAAKEVVKKLDGFELAGTAISANIVIKHPSELVAPKQPAAPAKVMPLVPRNAGPKRKPAARLAVLKSDEQKPEAQASTENDTEMSKPTQEGEKSNEEFRKLFLSSGSLTPNN